MIARLPAPRSGMCGRSRHEMSDGAARVSQAVGWWVVPVVRRCTAPRARPRTSSRGVWGGGSPPGGRGGGRRPPRRGGGPARAPAGAAPAPPPPPPDSRRIAPARPSQTEEALELTRALTARTHAHHRRIQRTGAHARADGPPGGAHRPDPVTAPRVRASPARSRVQL